MAAASDSCSAQTQVEVASLKEKFGKSCKVIKDVGDFKYVISIQLPNVDVSFKFQISGQYPIEPPQILTKAPGFAPEMSSEIRDVVSQKAASMCGRAMLADLVTEATQWLHHAGLDVSFGRDEKLSEANGNRKGHKAGKDGKKCKKAKGTKKTDPAEEVNEKKASMRTADDVIKRIQWDEALPTDCFIVGYLDRFSGIVEKNFSAFSWEDIASVDYTVLAIPKHRIHYFKYKELKIWDKDSRMDNVFGSTGSQLTCGAVIERYEELLARQKREAGSSKAPASSGKPKTRGGKDEDDDDDDDDDDIVINLGASGRANGDNYSCDSDDHADYALVDDIEGSGNHWENKMRPNYFLCMRVTDPHIVEGVEAVHSSVLESEPRYAECCVRPAALHVTLCTLGLDTLDQIIEAGRVLREAKTDLVEMAKHGIKIRVAELDNFYNRVLYARVHYEKDFSDIVQHVRMLLGSAGIDIRDNYDFVPHMTLMKTTRGVSREMKTSKIDSVMYRDFEDMTFGEQTLDAIYLCKMKGSRREDGFYVTSADIELI